jgi:hypothetical protein
MTSDGRMNKKYEMQSGNYSGNRVHKKYKIDEIKARELQTRSTTIMSQREHAGRMGDEYAGSQTFSPSREQYFSRNTRHILSSSGLQY